MPTERQGEVAEKPPIVYEHPVFTFVSDQRELTANGRTIYLTRREAELMYVLCTVPNTAVSYQEFFRWVTGSDFVTYSDEQNFKAIVYNLRGKLKNLIVDCDVVKSVRGVGYMLVDESMPDQGSTDQ